MKLPSTVSLALTSYMKARDATTEFRHENGGKVSKMSRQQLDRLGELHTTEDIAARRVAAALEVAYAIGSVTLYEEPARLDEKGDSQPKAALVMKRLLSGNCCYHASAGLSEAVEFREGDVSIKLREGANE
jgi:hypothetical protein